MQPQPVRALHSAFSGLSDVVADGLFPGIALDKTRRPWTLRTFKTLGLKTFLYRSTLTGSRSSPRVSSGPRDIPLLSPKAASL
jgi:hypothetical protein